MLRGRIYSSEFFRQADRSESKLIFISAANRSMPISSGVLQENNTICRGHIAIDMLF